MKYLGTGNALWSCPLKITSMGCRSVKFSCPVEENQMALFELSFCDCDVNECCGMSHPIVRLTAAAFDLFGWPRGARGVLLQCLEAGLSLRVR